MNNICKILLLLSFLVGIPVHSKESDHHATHCQICVLKSSGIVENTFIPPSKPLPIRTLRANSTEGETTEEALPQPSLFVPVFTDSVTDEIKIATNYALLIWETHISSSVPIKIRLDYSDLGDGGTLAQASPGNLSIRTENHLFESHLEPTVIKDRKDNTDASPLSYDIEVTINSNDSISFYTGIDGQCPPTHHDLVSILLHEVAHGLGFIDTISVQNPSEDETVTELQATFGFGGTIWSLFDHYLQNFESQNLRDPLIFPNPSRLLYDQVTSGNIYFSGPLSKLANNGFRPKLYAPRVWSSGSSIAHLDEIGYFAGSPNSLMTPRIGLGEVIHDPGPLLLGILGDIGWDHVWSDHVGRKDTEDLTNPIPIQLGVTSDSPLAAPPSLFYRAVPSDTVVAIPEFTEVPFSQTTDPVTGEISQPNVWSASIPQSGLEGEWEYYITVPASAGRVFRSPASSDTATFKFNVGPDVTPPVIQHSQPEFIFSNKPEIRLTATASDNLGIGELHAEILLNGQPYTGEVTLEAIGVDLFQFTIPLDISTVETFNYRFSAFDSSIARNGTVLPATGYYQLNIQEARTAVTAYQNTMNSADDWVLDGFTIGTPAGFDNPHLGSLHPYFNNGFGELFTHAYLKQQIQVVPGMTVQFDQIVLVEPPEEGNAFGDLQFWDYVIVEASKDGGITWNAITAGWDSSLHPDWLATYNQNINPATSVSSAVGNPTMFKPHTIPLDATSGLVPGDVIMLRFKLYSDPNAVGWGWAIDNLVIGI